MLIVRCKRCNRELISSSKNQVCGCTNKMELYDDKISANDLSMVVIVQNTSSEKKSVLTSEDIQWQEQRKRRKIRKLDFEVR